MKMQTYRAGMQYPVEVEVTLTPAELKDLFKEGDKTKRILRAVNPDGVLITTSTNRFDLVEAEIIKTCMDYYCVVLTLNCSGDLEMCATEFFKETGK